MGSQTFLGPGKRVHNALLSHEWEVGLEEMKSIRVFERIEQLKADKKWSFRQPKKQRIGVVPKAHWDYLLEEMVSFSDRSLSSSSALKLTSSLLCRSQRWLQTDFRQESRWKVVAAHRLARACRAWRRASPEARVGLCVRVRPPRFLDADAESGDLQGAMEVEEEQEEEERSMPTSPKGKEKEQETVAEKVGDGEAEALGEEETPAVDLANGTAATNPAPAGAGQAGGTGGDEKTLDPTKGSVSRSQQQQVDAAKQLAQAQHVQALINYRLPVFHLTATDTVIDPEVLVALREANAAGELSDEDLSIAELDLAALFPDLPLYSDFVLAEDINMARRVEDSSAWTGRLTNVTRLLETKPLLISTLQPGKTLSLEGWADETASFVEDIDPPVDARDQLPNTSSVLFAGRKPKDVSTGEVLVKPSPVPQPDVRASSILWLPDEDVRLLQLQRQYGLNWPLIAEIFNSATQRPPSDHRLPWDCFDRWDRLVGPGSKKTLPDGTEIKVPAPNYVPPVDKFGRSAPVIGNGSKKSARHVSIIEAMKKVQKQREANSLKAPRESSLSFVSLFSISRAYSRLSLNSSWFSSKDQHVDARISQPPPSTLLDSDGMEYLQS